MRVALQKALAAAGLAVLIVGMGPEFGRGKAFYHATNFAPYRFEDTIIRLRFDVPHGIVYGNEIATVRVKRSGLAALPFDSYGIHYTSVTVNGRLVAYDLDQRQQRVTIRLAHPATPAQRLTVRFTYWAHPQRGLYFIRPDAQYPHLTPEIWTQGEPTDNRRWFPTWDEPNQKTPSELVVTVPRRWTVVANGALKSHILSDKTETWDWSSPLPKSTYLIAFAAGPLVKHHTSLKTLDVDSFVQPPYAALNAICFGRTKAMIAYYDRIIGVRYPFAKYDQTTAERFDFGGMEDESATLVTARALHLPSEEAESSCDGLVSHELAQHWWGDDVTMADWSNAWINEGFATYYDELWTAKQFGEASFEYARYQAQQKYFDETAHYLRPIVDYVYANPLDLFDASGHERPAEILHMLRVMVGDARFFSALRSYLREYEFRNADTHQFFAAIEKSLHLDLTWFESQWFYRRDYPNFVVSDRYDSMAKTLTLAIAQRNIEGKPYRIPVSIQVFFDGRSTTKSVLVSTNARSVTIAGISIRPQMVLFDPNGNVLCKVTFAKTVDELAYQVRYAAHVADREWALTNLATFVSAQESERAAASGAVRRATEGDSFYGMRADAVAVAAAFGDDRAVANALGDGDNRVRVAAAGASAQLKGGASSEVVDALESMTRDPDPNVAAAAFQALGALKPPGEYERLVTALDRPSFRQAIAIGALRGLAAFGDARALPLLRSRTAYGMPDQERAAAAVALAQLAAQVQEPSAALPELLALLQYDPISSMRIAAANALSILRDRSAVPTLRYVERTDSQLLVQDAAFDAIVQIEGSAHER